MTGRKPTPTSLDDNPYDDQFDNIGFDLDEFLKDRQDEFALEIEDEGSDT